MEGAGRGQGRWTLGRHSLPSSLLDFYFFFPFLISSYHINLSLCDCFSSSFIYLLIFHYLIFISLNSHCKYLSFPILFHLSLLLSYHNYSPYPATVVLLFPFCLSSCGGDGDGDDGTGWGWGGCDKDENGR